MTFDAYEVALTVGGLAALLAAWIPSYLSRRPLSLPIVLVAAGALFLLLISIAVHGISATPAMALVDRAYRRQRRAGGDGRSHQDGQT
jgi:NhaP-type Na+/H+ or K+/H+ antiporter